MESNHSSIFIPSVVRNAFTEQELHEIYHADSSRIFQLLQKYGSRVYQGSTTAENPFSGAFDVTAIRVGFLKAFFPTAIARRSYLHLQSLADVTFGPDHFTTRSGVQSYLLNQTMFGAGRLVYQDRTYELAPGDVFFLDCHQPHDYRAASPDGWGYRFAHFDGYAMPDYSAQILSSGNAVFRFETDSPFDAWFTLLFDINRSDAPNCEFLSSNLLGNLLTEIMKTLPIFDAHTIPEHIQGICAWLTNHCCEEFSLDTVAAQGNLSKYHLSREFKRYMGRTIFDYVNQARLVIAKELMRYTDMPLSAISEYLGLDDQGTLSRLFRRLEGMSPREYRRQWKGL